MIYGFLLIAVVVLAGIISLRIKARRNDNIIETIVKEALLEKGLTPLRYEALGSLNTGDFNEEVSAWLLPKWVSADYYYIYYQERAVQRRMTVKITTSSFFSNEEVTYSDDRVI